MKLLKRIAIAPVNHGNDVETEIINLENPKRSYKKLNSFIEIIKNENIMIHVYEEEDREITRTIESIALYGVTNNNELPKYVADERYKGGTISMLEAFYNLRDIKNSSLIASINKKSSEYSEMYDSFVGFVETTNKVIPEKEEYILLLKECLKLIDKDKDRRSNIIDLYYEKNSEFIDWLNVVFFMIWGKEPGKELRFSDVLVKEMTKAALKYNIPVLLKLYNNTVSDMVLFTVEKAKNDNYSDFCVNHSDMIKLLMLEEIEKSDEPDEKFINVLFGDIMRQTSEQREILSEKSRKYYLEIKDEGKIDLLYRVLKNCLRENEFLELYSL